MNLRTMIAQLLAVGIAGLLLLCDVDAQVSAGKLTGKVIDAETKEPLIGISVVISGTSMGATTSIEGSYTMINIPPGSYDVNARSVGYRGQVVSKVVIVSGITKEINFALASSSIEVSEVMVVAERVFFEAKATNTVKVLDAEAINALPVRGVAQALGTQAGVVMAEGSGGVAGNPVLNVRGGRGGEVLYIVDGVVQNDIVTGTNYAQVGQDAVAQASFQIGGFEAKYGQANSGVMNIATRTGGIQYTFGGEAVSSSFTDSYGYRLFNLSASGPIIPNLKGHSFFINAERGLFADEEPVAIPLEFNSDTVFSRKTLPNNDGSVLRVTANTKHELGGSTLTLKANYNTRDSRTFIQTYEKWNSEHNPIVTSDNLSLSGQWSLPLGAAMAMNLTAGYKSTYRVSGDGVFRDRPLLEWGDTTYNKGLRSTTGQLVMGQAVNVDNVGIFYRNGRLNNAYTKMDNKVMSLDFQLSGQVQKHLVEAGASFELNTLRYYTIAPLTIARDYQRGKPLVQVYRDLRPYYFGYNLFGQNKTASGASEVVDTAGNTQKVGPKMPFRASAYMQDSYELEDLVIKFGLRFDYFDSKADILKDPTLPYAFGNPTTFDDADFVKSDPEVYFSPRIGFAFPVTPVTKFHAQFGVFIQMPRLLDLYTTPFYMEGLASDQNLGINTGHLVSEKTTQYELGFMQVLGDNQAGLNITAFYKNTKDLVNSATTFFQRSPGGQTLRYYGPTNSDFGTVRGLALTLDVARTSYISMAINYTYEKAEGTGSSTTSSYVATFRNDGGEVPKVIAPLDFDQRHTGSINVGFATRKGELGWLENTSVNLLATFNSGRPYTPLVLQNVMVSQTNYGETKGYVNSAYGPGSFLVNLRIERVFQLGPVRVAPYLWVENVFNVINAMTVYRTTGSPYTTAYLESDEGRKVAAAQPNPAYFISDYKTLERDLANNFGIPRLVRLGLRLNYGTD